MGKINLSKMKDEIKKSGTSKGKFLYFKEDTKTRIRFLQELDEGVEMLWHDSYQLGINVPCQNNFGRDCEYCEEEGLRTRKMYAWSVYDYESKEVKILLAAVNNCSPVPMLVSLYDSYGTITDRDYEIKKVGKGTNTTYSVIPLEKKKFRNQKVKALSEQSIFKYIDKAYPADNSEDLEGEEEETKRRKTKSKTKSNKTREKEKDEDEWDEDEEGQENDYESMSAKELYNLCDERGIDCKPRKSKEYYIDLLEEADEEESDDWDEDEESDDDWDE